MTLILHYAPDNASLAVRLALGEAGLPYATTLVDRARRDQTGDAYRRLHPGGLIPALETPDGPVFETAAILLWIAETTGKLAPAPGAPGRGRFLSWLFWLSNTLHATERLLFYPDRHAGTTDLAAFAAVTCRRFCDHLDVAEATLPATGLIGQAAPTILDCYLAPLLRWPALYARHAAPGWYDLVRWPGLYAAMERVEARPAAAAAARAEGLGPRPFTRPTPPHPPEGSAI